MQDVGIMSGPYCVSTQAQTRQEGTQNPGHLWHFGVLSGSFWRTDHLPDEYGVSGCFWQRFTYYNNCSCRSSEKRVVSGRLKPLKTLVWGRMKHETTMKQPWNTQLFPPIIGTVVDSAQRISMYCQHSCHDEFSPCLALCSPNRWSKNWRYSTWNIRGNVHPTQ